MLAVMERNMEKSRHSYVVSRAISEAAAARAVDDVIIDMIKAGFAPAQAKGIAYATQEFLVGEVGFYSRARQALLSAGIQGELTDDLLREIAASIGVRENAA